MSASVIAPVLTKIYNDNLKTSIYPQQIKNAKVVAIYKKGKKTDKANYRPISILPINSIIFERHVSIHLKGYLENNCFFTLDSQALDQTIHVKLLLSNS